MAVIKPDALLDVSRLAPPLDFYYWHGLLCVRIYPEHIEQPGTPAQLATWSAMTKAHEAWALLLPEDRAAFKDFTRNSPRTGRDLFMKRYLRSTADLGPLIPVFYNIKILGGFGGLDVTYLSNVPCTSYCRHGTQPGGYLPPLWRWDPAGVCIRGGRFTRRLRLVLKFPSKTSETPPTPTKTHHVFIPGPSPPSTTSLQIVHDSPQPEARLMITGTYTYTL